MIAAQSFAAEASVLAESVAAFAVQTLSDPSGPDQVGGRLARRLLAPCV